MPLRTAYRLCPQAIFLEGRPGRYREYSRRVRAVLCSFSPLVEMASIDEAYLDMTGCERLHGPPLGAAHRLHEAVKRETGLRCSIGIATTRLAAKIASDKAKPNGILYVLPGAEARFLAPLDVGRIPGVGKASERSLHALGIRKAGDLVRYDAVFLEKRFGKWGLALAAKARGEDAGAWFDGEIGAEAPPKSVSHEHTFERDTGSRALLEATLARLAEMVGRRLREQGLWARTVQIKLRYGDFRTLTRARTLAQATRIDIELYREARDLFEKNWNGGPVRLLGVAAASLETRQGQASLLSSEQADRWSKALSAADRLRDRYGESAVSLAAGLEGGFRERVHEAPPADGEAHPGSITDQRPAGAHDVRAGDRIPTV